MANRQQKRGKPSRLEVVSHLTQGIGAGFKNYTEVFVEPELRKLWRAVYVAVVVAAFALAWWAGVLALLAVGRPVFRDVRLLLEERKIAKEKE